MQKTTQDTINNVVWKACDTFRGTMDGSDYKDYVLTMLFVKYLSDFYKEKLEMLRAEYGEKRERIEAKLKKEKDKTLGHEIKRWLQNPLSLLGLETKRCIFASGFSVLKLWDDNHRTKTRATKPTKRISTDLSPPKHPFFYVHETHFLPVFSLLLLSLHCVCR